MNALPTCRCALLVTAALLAGCATYRPPSAAEVRAHLAPPTSVTRDLVRLPAPKGKIAAAVYGFRDQTGQYRPSPDSSFSTTVTQGAASMLIRGGRA
jgi:curli production assembly/transport component CsgG